MTSPIDIRPQDLATVRLYLERTLPPAAKVYVFGSRANWTTKTGSDLDLAVDAGSPLPQRTMVELADAFEESDLPYKVDVVDLQTVAPDFGARIRAAMVPFPSGRALNSTMDTWRRCKLGEILELKRGYDLPTVDRRPGRIPLVSSSGISDHIADAKVPGPGVVTGRYGTIGEVYYLNEPFWPLNTTLYVRDFKGNDPRFIAYLMKTLDFRAYSDKAAVPGLNRNHLHEAVVELPLDVGEQRAIAAVLGALDDKIELNRRMNETLETMARAIFKDWFVDFGPTRAKMEGRAPYLLPQLATCFPETLEGSEYGDVPRGWQYLPLGNLVELIRGTTYRGDLKNTPGPVLLGLASIKRNGGFRDDNLSTYGGDSPQKLLLKPGDIFASLKDVTQSADLLGAVARVPAHIPLGRLTQDTVKLAFRSNSTSRELVYRTLLSEAYRDYCRSRATGTTNLGLPREDFLSYPIIQPSEEIKKHFDSIAAPLRQLEANTVSESRTLAATRDLLLPKLMSGEVRVREAQKIVGEVA